MSNDSDSRIEVLKAVLADVEKERDRLRNARASFAVRLGPLPASVAVVTGIAAAAAGELPPWYVGIAGVLFVILLGFSIWYSGLKPYRTFRGEQTGNQISFRRLEPDLARWLHDKIRLETRIYGSPSEEKHRWWPARNPNTLTEALNSERAAANIVQFGAFLIFSMLIIGFGCFS